mmetsp:Transcript_4059/g.10370  ORF Transcript_4059/g.10370 Transcript_4059/m.10370 type:complete len:355 (-) Transcript_4059:49-1113(-)
MAALVTLRTRMLTRMLRMQGSIGAASVCGKRALAVATRFTAADGDSRRARSNQCTSTRISRGVGSSFGCAAAAYSSSSSTSSSIQGKGMETGTRKVALIQGASRGLGLQFASTLLERQNDSRVIACCRSPQDAHQLIAMQHDSRFGKERLHIVQLDLTDAASILRAAEQVRQDFASEIDLLINVSGVLHVEGKMMPETSLARVGYDEMLLSFQTHAIGPALVCRSFWPLLKESAMKRDERGCLPLVVNVSARVGSISDNKLGGWYSYRSSKAALNQLTKTMALEFANKKPRVAAIAIHPGTCDTDLSKKFLRNYPKDKVFAKDIAVEQMLRVIDAVEKKDNGKFFAWDGQEIPW